MYLLKNMQKSGFFWLPRPLDKVLVIWDQIWSILGQNSVILTLQSHNLNFFLKNLYSVLKNMWNSDLAWLSRPLDMVLAIQAKIWSSFWTKLANFHPVKHKFQIFMKTIYSVFKNMWKNGVFWLPRPFDKVLAI